MQLVRLRHIRLTRLVVLLLIIATTGMATRVQPAVASSPKAVVAWGGNQYGQSTVPADLSGVIAVSAGGSHTLALRADGTVRAWGYNVYGQTDVPAGLSGVTRIAAGYYHSLVLKEDGTFVGWGDNTYGQLNPPAGLTGVIAIATNWGHSVGLKGDGTVVAWGDNTRGQLDIPTGLNGVVAISAGTYHNLALKDDGTVTAWGNNNWGQLNVPAGLTGVIAISAGAMHSLALKADGTVVAWGDNTWGVLDVPVGLSNVTAIAAGAAHDLALKSDGTVVAWGNNQLGQLNIPADLNRVTAIAVSWTHSAVMRDVSADATPPSITAPAAVTVNATSPSGAVVSYSVTAADSIDPSPVVSCTPASGSTFPIGTTTVNCTATDASGNASSASFSATVLGADDQLSALLALVQSFNLQQGISNSLDAKLQNARDALEAARAGALASACNKLSSFVNEVQAQVGSGTLTQSQAEQLIAATSQIKAVLGCP